MAPNLRIPNIPNNPSKVQLSRLTHVYFEHPDLERFATFAKDFGFETVQRTPEKIYLGGYGKDPFCYVASLSQDGKANFRGGAFVAASEEEFNKASRLPGATVGSLKDAPGDGRIITIARPNGTFFYVTYGQAEKAVNDEIISEGFHSITKQEQRPYNLPLQKPRKGHFQRYHTGPALVHKLGHFGYVCKEFDEEINFYLSNFNFVPSDILHHPEYQDIDVLTFMHLDLGPKYSDHHSMFMQRAPPGTEHTWLHHSSYEIADFDEQLLGHYHLASKGYKSVWGVGRHILGSQIFDYWYDPSGFKIEHYADGDVVNESHVTKRDVAGPVSIWGPEMPKEFGEDGTGIAFG